MASGSWALGLLGPFELDVISATVRSGGPFDPLCGGADSNNQGNGLYQGTIALLRIFTLQNQVKLGLRF